MNIASNAVTLINLAWIGKLDLLRKLYSELIIPETMWQEVIVEWAEQPGAYETKATTWIKRHAVARSLDHAQDDLGSADQAGGVYGPAGIDDDFTGPAPRMEV